MEKPEFDDIPVECSMDIHEAGINVRHFRSLCEGEGYAKEGLNRVIEYAEDKGFNYVVVNMGRFGHNTVGFLEHMGFSIVESHNGHVTAEYDIE